MLFDAFLILVGLGLLLVGGEALVRGAGGVALLAKVTPTVVGLTVVAAGTSMPELVVSVQAAVQGNPGIAIGNVVGSNIFNIAAILGLTALVQPLAIRGNTVRLEWPIMVLAAFQLHLLARDGTIDRLEGGFFVAGLVAFISYTVLVARKSTEPVEQQEFASEMATASFGRTGGAAWGFNILFIVLGGAALAGGSTALVEGAVGLATRLGVPSTIIGLTIVSAGTSTPELFTSLVAARRGNADIAVANAIGSNIFNVLCIAGVTALVHPLPVPLEILVRDNWWMIGISLFLIIPMRTGMRIVRSEGAVLVAVFLAYMTLLILQARG